MKLGIIAGHGQGDPGACANGQTEHDNVKRVAERLHSLVPNSVLYPTDKDCYANGDIVQWARSNGIDQIVEFHQDAASPDATKGSVLICDAATDNVDAGFNNVIAKYFGTRGFIKREDLQNVRLSKRASISYRLVEICFITNTGEINKFNAQFDNICNDFASIFGVDVSPSAPKAPEFEQHHNIEVLSLDKGTGQLKAKGWAFDTRLQPDKPTDFVAGEYTLFAMSGVTGREIARTRIFKLGEIDSGRVIRNDVTNAFKGFRNVGYGGFDTVIQIPSERLNDPIFLMMRFESHNKYCVDIYMRDNTIDL